MSQFAFKLPDIGEGIAEAEIVVWHVKLGDFIEEDAPLADMMTDKATVEISAPVSGTLVQVAGEVGDLIAIGSVLAVLEGSHLPEQPDVSQPRPALEPTDIATEPAVAPAPNLGAEAPRGQTAQRPSASPAVRRRASDLGIDLADVKCADDNRVRHSDIDAFLSYNAAYRSPTARCADEAVKVIGLRRRIAENVAASKRNIPHFTYIEEIDVTQLEIARAELNAHRGDRPKLTVLPLLIVAVCRAVADFPMLNARFDDEAGVVNRSGAVHMGIATQTEAGLLVPVIRNAQDRNIWQLSSEIQRLANAARSGQATSAELSGSTLTITSLGPLGGIATTPVINRPEVAIIGPNRIVERLVLRDDAIRQAKIMNLSISCDHRVVDGWDAASCVQRIKTLLESPTLLFI